MCGIAGYISNDPMDRQLLINMVDALIHRGPDSSGYFSSGNFSVGMRRLSINDLSNGNQPLYNEDRTIVLVYNGEIYNYPSLRKQLESRGHRFSTASDGEVICHLYEEKGEDAFSDLDGMFAIALWDEHEQKLVLARDIPGEKPLYFTKPSENEIVFASELRSILLFPGIDKQLNLQAIWDFPTFLWVPEPATVYRSIECLMPGHLLTMSHKGTTIRKYRNLFDEAVTGDLTRYSTEDLVALTREVVTDAVKSRLLADVPVGCFLSSGLDSSIVATLASRYLTDVSTFTIAFEDLSDPYHGSADESLYAAQYAKYLGTTHRTISVSENEFLLELPKFCHYAEQPFSVSSGLGVLSISHAAREAGIKVMLTGDGADEIFGGYSWYSFLQTCDLASRQGQEPLSNDVVSFQNTGLSVEQRIRTLSTFPAHQRAWAWHYYADESEKLSLFNREAFSGTESSLRHFAKFNSALSWKPLDYICQDREFYFPFEMLRKADRMTMANSVEGRVPFAAPSVIAHGKRLSLEQMIHGSELKWILREAFKDLLPEQVRTRPKHGFNVPIDHWLKGKWHHLVDETFAPSSSLAHHGLITPASASMAERLLNDPGRLNGHTIFSYVMLNLWLQENYGNNS